MYQSTTYLNLVIEFKVFAWTVCFVDNFWEIKFLSAIVGQGMTALEQNAMDLLLEHTKPQHTRIWLLNLKYLLGQSFMWTTVGNDYQKFLRVIFEYFTIPLSTKLWVYHWNMSKLHIIEYGVWVLLFKVNYSVFCECLPHVQYHALLQSGAQKLTSRTF